jgi:regulation of enolase protein 1 (concanavalin A-like superfamily)
MNVSIRLWITALTVALSLFVLPLRDDEGVRARDTGSQSGSDVRAAHEEGRGPDPDKPDRALAFRALALRDDLGRIAPDGWLRAKKHVDAMKAAKGARRSRTGAARDPRTGADAPAMTQPSAIDATGDSVAMSAPLTPTGWTPLGPGNVGGRVRSILVHPTTPATMFAGSVGGGIWKTLDGGASWAPVADFMANLAVTSMVFHPTNPSIMYAATGEGYNNADAIRGAGIFKSTDGGTTWNQLAATADVSFHYVLRLAISPDGRVLLAGTRMGLFRSTDGGTSFTRTSGPVAVDIDFHPTNAMRAVAGDRGGRAWVTADGGVTWVQAALALPAGMGSNRVEIAYARATPDVVYAVVDRNGGLVYRSADGGTTYTQVYASGTITLLENGQGWYDLAVWVNPRDSNDLIVGGVNLYRSRDAAYTFTPVSTSNGQIHADQHIIVEHPRFDNVNTRTLFIGNDGGVYKVPDLALLTSTATARYQELNNRLAVTQFYGAAGNPATGVIVGGTQDNGTLVYDPDTGSEGWRPMFGGDGGFSAADATNPAYLYGEYVYLQIHRSTDGGVSSKYIFSGIADAAQESAPRSNFIAPFILDPNDSRRMLAGGTQLWRSDDVRATVPAWKSIKAPGDSFISAIAVAAGNSNVVWVGHNNGDLFRTANGTAAAPTWTKVDPTTFPNRFITRITIDPFDANVVYVTFGGFVDQNVQRTGNGGVAWADATGTGSTGLPLVPVRDLEVDPTDSTVLWVATEIGVFTSRDRGLTWDPTQDGPANVSVDELFIMNDSLYAVTHGRGLFRHLLSETPAAPSLTFSPSSRAFGAAAVGSSTGAVPISIANSGSAPLHVASVRVAGTHPGDWSLTADGCSGVTVAPAASCVVQVSFRPTAAGQRSGLLSVTSDAAGAPHAAALTGDGVLAAPAPVETVPSPWATRDIGAVGVAGSASYASGRFTVRGAGSVSGTADAFRFVYRPLSGDGTIIARVASVQNVQAWVKAGVMIRQSLAAESVHGFMLVSAARGLVFLRRSQTAGTSAIVATGAGTAPVWVKLERRGQTVKALRSADGITWSQVGQATFAFTGTVYVGLAVSSHTFTSTAAAAFDKVSVTAGPLPAAWQSRDIGTVGVAGKATESVGTFVLKGGGADLGGTADAFRFAYRSWTGDGTVVAKVTSVQGTQAGTKIGVMIRASTAANAAHALMLVSSGQGLAFQRRTAAGGTSTSTSGGAGTAPRWLKLKRVGNVVTASISLDAITWKVVGSATIALPSTALVGLVAHSHTTTALATGTFTDVTVQR